MKSGPRIGQDIAQLIAAGKVVARRVIRKYALYNVEEEVYAFANYYAWQISRESDKDKSIFNLVLERRIIDGLRSFFGDSRCQRPCFDHLFEASVSDDIDIVDFKIDFEKFLKIIQPNLRRILLYKVIGLTAYEIAEAEGESPHMVFYEMRKLRKLFKKWMSC